MFAVQRNENADHGFSVHALPCKLHHNGPVDAKRFSPSLDKGASKSAVYFRGRKLEGRTTRIPDNYEGHVLRRTDRKLPQEPSTSAADQAGADTDEDEGADEAVCEEVKVMENTAVFNGVTIWTHGGPPDLRSDPYARGLHEWIAFAESIHGKAPTASESVGGSDN